MGKKSSHSSILKASKHERKQLLNNLIKIQRPKVYITNSSNFKNLVQQLTGKRMDYPVAESSPPPTWEEVVPFSDSDHHYHHLDESYSLDSSCFASPLDGSPDVSINSSDKQKMEFYKELEAMLMDMDSSNCDYNACYNGRFGQDQACFYDYDLSTFIRN